MCGFTGFININQYSVNANKKLLEMMSDAIMHRGPDDFDTFVNNNICLAHRRLSIIDLSKEGRQPMVSESGDYIIVFNGEIYNHGLIRNDLDSIRKNSWRGHSDTEVLLRAIELLGLERALNRCKGMFAFALWDKRRKRLALVRDRIGEKPLYYGWVDGSFVFASEISSIKKFPKFNNKINREAISLLMRYSYIPAPHSIYTNIFKLEAGTILYIDSSGRKTDEKMYWSSESVINNGILNPFQGSKEESIVRLEEVLSNAVLSQMEADVPLGAFLSGGVDSSLITSLMQKQSMDKVMTFSIGFNEKSYNEAEYAKSVANHLGTEHYELYVSSQDVLDVIPKLSEIYSEPFADSSQIPTYLVSRIARERVTVALSGDAGDELFGGYNRYLMANNFWNKISKTPLGLRKIFSKYASLVPENLYSSLPVLKKRYPDLSNKIQKGINILTSESIDDLYSRLTSLCNLPDNLVLNTDRSKIIVDRFDRFDRLNGIEKMMALDLLTYLPSDILTKVDRASMANSLETRVPFLDHNVVEFAWSLPFDYKINRGVGKWPLRSILYKYVPKEMIERPKAGFAVPIDQWLRGPLKDWAESYLNVSTLAQQGFLNVDIVRSLWEEHILRKKNNQQVLWNILMFQVWLENEK